MPSTVKESLKEVTLSLGLPLPRRPSILQLVDFVGMLNLIAKSITFNNDIF